MIHFDDCLHCVVVISSNEASYLAWLAHSTCPSHSIWFLDCLRLPVIVVFGQFRKVELDYVANVQGVDAS